MEGVGMEGAGMEGAGVFSGVEVNESVKDSLP